MLPNSFVFQVSSTNFGQFDGRGQESIKSKTHDLFIKGVFPLIYSVIKCCQQYFIIIIIDELCIEFCCLSVNGFGSILKFQFISSI